ncbi:(ZYRO0G20504g) [Zygosaccharomyces parabailii]|nr:(ZYRO0G20504g) [Zygosaccharomyces parabailii]CDH10199.1 uncharacterized protein ZBAI_01984 [Zygosaccharomyces bailii ISA1307]
MSDLYHPEPQQTVVEQVRFGKTKLFISPIIIDLKLSDLKTVDSYHEKQDKGFSEMIKYCYDRGLRTFSVDQDNGAALSNFLRRYKLPPTRVVIASRLEFPPAYNPEFTRAKLTKQSGFLRTYVFKRVKELLYGVGKHIDILEIASWDPTLSREELLSALTELVARGDVRYTTIRAKTVEEFKDWQQLAEKNNWTKFSGLQLTFGLFHSEFHKDKIRYARENGIGLLSCVPSDGGVAVKPSTTERRPAAPQRQNSVDLRFLNEEQHRAFESLQAIAERKGVARTVVLAARALMNGIWPMIGCSSVGHVEQALKAFQTHLTPQEWASLEVHLG